MNAAVALVCSVFLVPGAFGPGAGGASHFVSSDQYFAEYRDFFAEKGCAVKIGVFPPDATIEERALVFRDQLERFVKENGNRPAWVVAHSQGALDVRFALKSLKVKEVARVASIGAPHTGTPLANWVVKSRDSGTALYWALRLLAGYDLRALRFAPELTFEFLEKHGSHFEAVPGVRYGSAVGNCKTSCSKPVGLLSWWVGLPSGDGIVPATSQVFGENLGEFDLDHLSEIATDEAKRPERRRLLVKLWDFFSRQ